MSVRSELPIVLVVLSLAACGPDRRPDEPLPAPPAPLPGPGEPAGGPASAVAPVESLSLTQALALVDAQHPDLEALRLQLDAASARAYAAGRFPAPAALIRAENVPLHRGRSLDQGNYIAGLVLSLPLQGRLSAARAVEERAGELVSRELELRRHDLLRETRDAFVAALVATRAAALQTEASQAAQALAALLRRRVELGDASPDEPAWAEAEASRSRVDAQRSLGQARRALARLTAALGSDRPVGSVTGDLEETLGVPDLAVLLERVEQGPRVRRASAEVALREAALELAEAERIPDIEVELAYRRLEPSDQHAVDAGLVIPFPFLGGRSDLARAASSDLEAARARARAARLETRREIQDAYERLAVAVAVTNGVRESLPRIEEAVAAAEARLARGDVSAFEVLPVRRAAIGLGLEHLAAMAEAVQAWADLAAALGTTP